MTEPFEILAERGDRWPENRRLHVTLYADTPAESAACSDGGVIPSAVRHGADQLYEAGAVSYYRIARFTTERDGSTYPRVDADDPANDFEDYLRGTTEEFSDAAWCADGDCASLLGYRGAHLLVHGHGFSTRLAGAEPVACGRQGGTGFSRGAAAWTGVDESKEGLTRNSAIHETVHLFVRSSADSVRELLCDADGDGGKSVYEEHTLGAIDETGAVTPMLTYHVDEHAGCRHPPRTWDGSYSQELTDRTKTAVSRTARDQCRPQPGVTERR